MSQPTMFGLTHRGAPMDLLERVAIARELRPRLLAALQSAGVAEAVVLSTCSRTEIYSDGTGGPELLLETLAAQVGRPAAELAAAAETRVGRPVVDHLFRLAAGLDSRVVGEVEIHGQLRTAFRTAQAEGMTGSVLGQLMPAALRCGLRVREETTLGAHARSLGRRAVEVGLATLDTPQPLIIVVGSGRMAATAVEQLARLGLRPRVAARDEEHAARLAGGPGQVCPLAQLADGVGEADLLICATSAAHHVVTLEHVRQAMESRTRPLTVVDLSVPRNVDVAVADLPGVLLIDLEGMNDDGSTDPELTAAVRAAESIVRSAADRYAQGVAARDAGSVIAALRHRVEEICRLELARAVGPRGPADEVELARAAHAVAGKLMHGPTVTARAAAAAGDGATLQVLCQAFGLAHGEASLRTA